MRRSTLIAALMLSAAAAWPDAAAANRYLRLCLNADVRSDTMQDQCQRAIRQGGLTEAEEAAAWTNIGTASAELDRFGDAIAAYDQAVAADPTFAPAFLNRAIAREKRGLLKGALEDYAATLALRPGHRDALMGRGALYLRRGLPAEALRDFEAASGRGGGDAYYNRGLALLALGRDRDAEAAFTATLRLSPGDAAALVQRGVARQAADPRAAERDFADAIAARPEWPDPYVARGRLRDRLGDRTAANGDFRRAWELGHQELWLNERMREIGG